MTRKDDKGDQPSGGETTWTNTGATRYGRGQHRGNDLQIFLMLTRCHGLSLPLNQVCKLVSEQSV